MLGIHTHMILLSVSKKSTTWKYLGIKRATSSFGAVLPLQEVARRQGLRRLTSDIGICHFQPKLLGSPRLAQIPPYGA